MSGPCMALAPDYPIRMAVPRRLATGPEAVLAKVRIRLATVRGVWGEDRLLGLPWLSWSIVPPDVEIQAQVSRQVAAVEGVLSIEEVAVSVLTGAVSIAVRLRIQSAEGPVLAVVGDLGIWDGYTPGGWFAILQVGHRQLVRGNR